MNEAETLGTALTVENTSEVDRMHPLRSSKEIAAEIERLKVELRGAKAREKEQMTGEGKAALDRERGAKEELARALKMGMAGEPGGAIWADVTALVAAGWDREQGTWRHGDRLLFLSRTGWVAGRVGTRDWKSVVSVSACVDPNENTQRWEGP